MIAQEQTVLIVEHELRSAAAWAGRHNAHFQWLKEQLELRLALKQPQTDQPFFLKGTFADYKVHPPAWGFCTADWELSTSQKYYPKPITKENMPGSIFINDNGKGVICAHFNRLAYGLHAGPHKDWSDLAQWQAYAPGNVRATTIGEMLNVIRMHFLATNGRMGNE